MKPNRIEEGRFTVQGKGAGTVSPEMIEQRAREIALMNGRSEQNVLDTDIAQARRELLGEERLYPNPTAAEQLTEESRWPGNPESESKRAETVQAPDEQTFAEKLVEEGVADAEHDQEVQATRESLKRDKLS